jgi:hypothetical protein
LKRLSQKALPAFLFSKGGKLLGDVRLKIPLFPPSGRGRKGKVTVF